MADLKLSAGAKATVTLEVTSLGSWSGEATAAQVFRQAKEMAEGAIRKMVADAGVRNVRVVGDIKVTMVYASNE